MLEIMNENGRLPPAAFTVTNIYRFQALDPTKSASDFVDLDTGQRYSGRLLFNRMYGGARHLIFQTCIYANGDLNWGRLFVLAEPLT